MNLAQQSPQPNQLDELLVEIEQRVLGWLLTGAQGAADFAQRVPRGAFHAPLDRIAVAIAESERDGLEVSPAAIALKMATDRGLAELGGAEFLRNLAMAAPAVISEADGRKQIEGALQAHGAALAHFRATDLLQAVVGGEMTVLEAWDRLRADLESAPGAHRTPIFSSEEFIADFEAPEYLWDGILVRGFVYSQTGKTGSGKTALAQRLMAHVGLGRPLGARSITQGAVLMLAGENPDDVRMRWIALAEQMGFAASEMPVSFRPGTGSIADILPGLARYADKAGGLALVVVDTSAAFFPGEEENSNKEIGDHARTLRRLSMLPGRPTVLVNCHPTKNARDDELLPRGGGAFLAEMDGNLTVRNAEGAIEMHWQGKFRGPDFAPIAFECLTVESNRLVTARGRRIPTVVAHALSDAERASKALDANADAMRLLRAMVEDPGASLASLATAAGWISGGGEPLKSKVSRVLHQLKAAKLAEKTLDKWTLTAKGARAAGGSQ